MREDIPLYERAFAMDDYAQWKERDASDPKATPHNVVDWLTALDAAAGIDDDDSEEQARRLMRLVEG